MTDYKALCQEIFGTIDENEIRKLAKNINKKSGRKPKFGEDEIKDILSLASCGTEINLIAKKYNTSRQVISRYLNRKKDNYNVRLTYMYKQFPCTIIDADYLNKKIIIQNRTDDILHRAFGAKENPNWEDYNYFLKERCFPQTRTDIKAILKELGIDSYDPYQICKKTNGRTYDDACWIKFEGRKRNE